jgi:flagellar biosynthesis GTPase FlhF
MIVVDTAAPGSPDAVVARASELAALSLDAIFLAVPATLGAPAARQLLERLAPLSPTGMVITHADETDQLGVAVELSCSTGIPVAYVLEGASLDGALSAPDPSEIAHRLLP